jgi:hypothetical protein
MSQATFIGILLDRDQVRADLAGHPRCPSEVGEGVEEKALQLIFLLEGVQDERGIVTGVVDLPPLDDGLHAMTVGTPARRRMSPT